MRIREPVLEDAQAMGTVHVRAWQEGYKDGLMPDEFLASLSAAERAETWVRILERPPRPRFGRWAAEAADGTVVGHIMVGPADGDVDSDVGEVFSLNVDPDEWGRGFGGALLDRGVRTLDEAGFTQAILWVHTDNQRARRFYETHRWASQDENRTIEVFGVKVPETSYRLEQLIPND